MGSLEVLYLVPFSFLCPVSIFDEHGKKTLSKTSCFPSVFVRFGSSPSTLELSEEVSLMNRNY